MRYVHIAGTNGKGSVAEYISNILAAAGYRCGCYTSPHLISATERMRINGEYISEEELNNLLQEVSEKALAVNDSQFAAYTAAAMQWFERREVDIAVMETGLGGRLDPTNCIQPSVVVLTTIDYDHMDLLGNTLEQIAGEKCGIIKQGVPVVSAMQHQDAVKVIYTHCRDKQAPLKFVHPVNIISGTPEGQIFEFGSEEFFINAIGATQPANAALAILAARELGLGDESIKSGLANTKIRCRIEYIKGNPDIIIDGGHNTGAVRELTQTLLRNFPERKYVLLFACMKDKDFRTIVKELSSLSNTIVITRADETRGAPPEELREQFPMFKRCIIEEDEGEAFSLAKSEAQKQNALLVVCGSFYLAGYISNLIDR
jgi:dihydrofolate synthase/folylpolyglutamate synthase